MKKQIQALLSDYVNGTGEYGSVHKKYAQILKNYQSKFTKIPEFYAEGIEARYEDEYDFLKKGVIVDIVCLVLSILGFGSRLAWVIMSFVIMIIKMWTVSDEETKEDTLEEIIESANNNPLSGKSGKWGVLPIAVVIYVVVSFISNPMVNYTWFIIGIPLLLDMLKRINVWKIEPIKAHRKNKNSIIMIRKAEEELNVIRKQLKECLPELEKEYEQQLKELFNVSINDVSDAEFPKFFWWDVNNIDILEKQLLLEKILESPFYSHQCTYFDRTSDKKYKNAGEEYSPLYDEHLSKEQLLEIYEKNLNTVKQTDGLILEFVDCQKFPEIVEKSVVVDDMDYKYSSLERSYLENKWQNVRSDYMDSLSDGYSSGYISQGKYQRECFFDTINNREIKKEINKKVKVGEHIETYQSREIFATVEWIGQLLLKKNFDDTYTILDYRCRPEYEFENINYLKKRYTYFHRIKEVMPEHVYADVTFIAKLKKILFKNEEVRQAIDKAAEKDRKEKIKKTLSISYLCAFFSLMGIFYDVSDIIVLVFGSIIGLWQGIKVSKRYCVKGKISKIAIFTNLALMIINIIRMILV